MVIEDFIFVVYFTLNCSCNLQGWFFSSLLLPGKRSKSPGTRKEQSSRSLFTSCLKATFLSRTSLVTQACRLFFGRCGTPSVSCVTHLTHSQTVLALFPKNSRALTVLFNGAGWILKLLLPAIIIATVTSKKIQRCQNHRQRPQRGAEKRCKFSDAL